MTYRFGRTSKGRYAATISGIPAYQSDSCKTNSDCGNPLDICVAGQCQQVSITAPTSGRSKPKRHKKRRYGKTRKRRASKVARAKKCPTGMKPSSKPGVMCELAR